MTQIDTTPSAPTPDDVVLPQERRFRVGDREIVVKPLPIGRYAGVAAEFGAVCERVAREHPEIDPEHPERHLQAIFPIFVHTITGMFERLFGVEAEYLDEHMTLAQAMEIAVAFLEAQQVPDISKNARRALQLLKETPTI